MFRKPKKITWRNLIKAGACSAEAERFKIIYPKGLVISEIDDDAIRFISERFTRYDIFSGAELLIEKYGSDIAIKTYKDKEAQLIDVYCNTNMMPRECSRLAIRIFLDAWDK